MGVVRLGWPVIEVDLREPLGDWDVRGADPVLQALLLAVTRLARNLLDLKRRWRLAARRDQASL
jgi:hypothetical protein